MFDQFKVTIMIPTYNQAKYIQQAIESALNQSYENLEIIVSDDSENNETKEIVKHYLSDKRVKYFHNIPRLGRVKNYFKSLNDYATGEWVLNLDGDDYLANNSFISAAMNVVQENNDIVMVFGRELKLNMKNGELTERTTNRNIPRILNGTDVFLNKRKNKINFYHLSTIYKRNDAIKCGFYTDDYLGTDSISFMKLVLGQKIAFIDEICGTWRFHEKNQSFIKNINLIMENIESSYVLYYYSKNLNIIDNNKLKSWCEKSIIVHFETYLINFLLLHEYGFAYNIFKEFKKRHPKFFYKMIWQSNFLIKIFFVLFFPFLYSSHK